MAVRGQVNREMKRADCMIEVNRVTAVLQINRPQSAEDRGLFGLCYTQLTQAVTPVNIARHSAKRYKCLSWALSLFNSTSIYEYIVLSQRRHHGFLIPLLVTVCSLSSHMLTLTYSLRVGTISV